MVIRGWTRVMAKNISCPLNLCGRLSNRRSWLEKYHASVFPHEYVINYKRRPVMTPRVFARVAAMVRG